MDILYMWSDMDSGNATPERTHPVRLVVFSCPIRRKKDRRSSAVFESAAHDVDADAISDEFSYVGQWRPTGCGPDLADQRVGKMINSKWTAKIVFFSKSFNALSD